MEKIEARNKKKKQVSPKTNHKRTLLKTKTGWRATRSETKMDMHTLVGANQTGLNNKNCNKEKKKRTETKVGLGENRPMANRQSPSLLCHHGKNN